MNQTPNRPRDRNELSKLVVDLATGEIELPETALADGPPDGKNPDAVALGKLGGAKGGKARAAKLSKAERSEIAKKAADKRWRRAAEPPPQPSASDADPSPAAGGLVDRSRGPGWSGGGSPGEAVPVEELRRRRREWTSAYAEEIEAAKSKSREAKRYWLNAERLRGKIEELDELLASIGQAHRADDVIPLLTPIATAPRPKPSQRYRTPCATTDIVALAYASPGITVEDLVTRVYEKYKDHGTSRDSITKMVNRLIREKYASKWRGRLMLEDVCKRAWESSPLYPASPGP